MQGFEPFEAETSISAYSRSAASAVHSCVGRLQQGRQRPRPGIAEAPTEVEPRSRRTAGAARRAGAVVADDLASLVDVEGAGVRGGRAGDHPEAAVLEPE